MSKHLSGLPLIFLLLVLFANTATAQIPITYDEDAQLSRTEQVAQVQNISAENCALIARTQAERWLAWNRKDLNDQQLKW